MRRTYVRYIMNMVIFMSDKFSYQTITCKSALNKINSFLPYHYDLNIYRGCEHHCVYCFAKYSHRYLEDNQFFNHIYIKENIVEELEKKLSSKSWKRDVINLGGITDSYQPIEKEMKLMPEILKLLIKYKTPAIISTKSSLILRDIDLLKELSKVAGVQIACTITTLDQNLASIIEPNASSVKKRIQTIQKLGEEGLTVGWHLMPIIPYITATRNNLKNIFEVASKCKVDYMITGLLNLRGITRTEFFQFVLTSFPEKHQKLWNLYHQKDKMKEYKIQLFKLLNQLEKEYQVNRNYQKYVPKGKEQTQLELF